MRQILFSVLLAGVFFITFMAISGYTHSGTEQQPSTSGAVTSLPQIIQSPSLPEFADFCGELLPIHEQDGKERLDLEVISNCYRHSSTILYMKRAGRYFPTIEKILAEEGMPEDLKYLCVAESSLSNATSPAGAKGFWQFMQGTGREMGLTVNSEVDERLHLEKSTRAACKYLRQLKGRFGSWTLAAAAYNMGGANLNKNLSSQKASNYHELNVNEETMRYIYRIAAIKEIMQNPRNFGFYIDESQKYPQLPSTQSVQVDGPVPSWADFAAKHGLSYRELKIYNPWLIDSKLTNSKREKYNIKIPRR